MRLEEQVRKFLPNVPIGQVGQISAGNRAHKFCRTGEASFKWLPNGGCKPPYFDRVVCLTLDTEEGAKRREKLEINLKVVGWHLPKVEYFFGFKGSVVPKPTNFISGNGAWGCLLSHMRILENAMNDGVQRLLVLEDDCEFALNFRQMFDQFIAEVPENWEGLFLGGQFVSRSRPWKRIKLSEHVAEVAGVERTHAVAYQGDYIRYVYEAYRKGTKHCDHINGPLQHGHRVYAPIWWLAGQAENKSQICGKSFDKERYWQPTVFTGETPIVTETRPIEAKAPSVKQIERRRKICAECPSLREGICVECKCSVQAKTKQGGADCPLKKWNTEFGLELLAGGSKIIHQVWVQGEDQLPENYKANRDAWSKVLPDGWRMVLWDEKMAVDQWPDFAKYTSLCSHHAMRCDLILARAQRDFGGLAMGTDVTPNNPKKLFTLCETLENFIVTNIKGNSASNGLSWFSKPQNDFITVVCKHQLRDISLLGNANVPVVTGPSCWWTVVKSQMWKMTYLSDDVAYTHRWKEHPNKNVDALVNPGYAGSWHIKK